MNTASSKTFNLAVLSVGVLLIKSLWFSASAVIPQLAEVWDLTATQRASLTMLTLRRLPEAKLLASGNR